MASGIFNFNFTPTAITPSSTYEHNPFLNDLQKFKLIRDEQTQKNEFFDFIRAKITSTTVNDATREKYEKLALIYGEDQLGISRNETFCEIKAAYTPTASFVNLHQGNPTSRFSLRLEALQTMPDTSLEKEELKRFLEFLGQSASTTNLERALKEREAELAEQKKASQALEAANATLKSDLTQLRSSNYEQQQRLTEAAEKLDQAKAECLQTAKSLKQEEASAQATQLTEKIAKLQSALDESQKTLADQAAEKEKLEAEMTLLSPQHASEQEDNTALMAAKIEKLKQLLKNKLSLWIKNNQLRTHLQQAQDKEKGLQSQLEQAKAKEAKFNEIAGKLEDQAELKIQIERLQVQLAKQAQSVAETYQKQITELSKQHESHLKSNTEELQAKIETLSTEITELKNQQPEAAPLLNVSVQPPLNSSAAAVEEKDVADARALLKELKANYEAINKRDYSTKMKNGNFIIWNNLIQSQKTKELLDNIDTIEPTLVIQMASLIKSVIDAQTVVFGKEKLLKDPQIKERLTRLQQLEAANKTLQKENGEIMDKQIQQLKDLQSKDQQITQLQKQVKESKKHEEENERLKESLELLQRKLTEQESKYEAALTAALQEQEKILSTQHAAEVASMQQKIDQSNSLLQVSEKTLAEQSSKAAAELQDQKDQLSTQHATKLESIQQHIAESEIHKEENKELKASIQTLKSKLQQQESDHQTETERLKKIEQEQVTLIQQKEAETERLKAQVKALKESLPFPPDQMDKRIQDLQRIIIQHGNEQINRAILRILETIEGKNKAADEKLQLADEEMQKLRRENSDLLKQIKVLNSISQEKEIEKQALTIANQKDKIDQLEYLIDVNYAKLKADYEKRLASQNIGTILAKYDSIRFKRNYVEDILRGKLEYIESLRKKITDLEGRLPTSNNSSTSPDRTSETHAKAATPLKVVKQLRSRTERKGTLARTPGRSSGNNLMSMSQPIYTSGRN